MDNEISRTIFAITGTFCALAVFSFWITYWELCGGRDSKACRRCSLLSE